MISVTIPTPRATPANPPGPRFSRSRLLALAAVLILSLICPSCLTPEQAVAEVDEEAYGILADKQIEVRGVKYAFRVDPPKGRVADRIIDPETGLARQEEVLIITLAAALEIAAENSRDFQAAKETLYRSALNLMGEREDFRNTPFALLSGDISKSGGTESIDADGDFGVTRMLERGGSYALTLGLDFLRVISAPTSEDLTSFLNLSISLPFLRNAGREIAYENLTQADRDALYAMRDFERFKQTFGVRVMSSYLRLLSQKRRIENEEANLESLAVARERNEELFAEERINIVQVDQTKQSELLGRDRLVVAIQAMESSLDNFKDLLGLPVDMKADIRLEDLQALDDLITTKMDWTSTDLTILAFKSRLDFRSVVDGVADAARRVVVAENQLKPSLNLNLSARATSDSLKPLKYNFDNGIYTAGLDFDPGFDLDLESISLRRSILDFERSLRSQEDFVNQVKLEVQSAVRQLQQNLDVYRISQTAVKLAEQRVESSRLFLEEGRVETRDFLESQEALISNQNTLVRNLVEYRIAYLELLRDTGALVVSPEGLDHDTSSNLLELD